MDIAMMKLHR